MMADSQDGREVSTVLLDDERLLLRLYRCLSNGDKDDMLLAVGQQAMRRFSVDPCHGKPWNVADDEMAPERVEEFDDRLMGSWPGDWPERTIDLDDMGDAGFFLQDAFSNGIASVLFASSSEDESMASMLADSFITRAEENAVPLPWDFGGEPEETVTDITMDFVRFIRAWRERVVHTIEKQALEGKAE